MLTNRVSIAANQNTIHIHADVQEMLWCNVRNFHVFWNLTIQQMQYMQYSNFKWANMSDELPCIKSTLVLKESTPTLCDKFLSLNLACLINVVFRNLPWVNTEHTWHSWLFDTSNASLRMTNTQSVSIFPLSLLHWELQYASLTQVPNSWGSVTLKVHCSPNTCTSKEKVSN